MNSNLENRDIEESTKDAVDYRTPAHYVLIAVGIFVMLVALSVVFFGSPPEESSNLPQ